MQQIIETICHIAHYTNTYQFSIAQTKLFVLLNALQMASFMFPLDGWDLWGISNEPFEFLKTLIHIPLITPLLLEYENQVLTTLLQIVGLALISFVTGCILGLAVWLKYNSRLGNKNTYTYQGWQQVIVRFVYFYFIVLNSLLYMPLSSLYFISIFCEDKQDTINCVNNSMFFPSLLGQVLLVFHNCIGIYFFRCYQFAPQSLLQLKFAPSQYLSLALKTIAIALGSVTISNLVLYMRLICLNLLFINNIFELITQFPYTPQINQFAFICAIILESLCLIVSCNVVSNDFILEYKFMLFYTLLVVTFAIVYAKLIYNSYRFKQNREQGTQSDILAFAQDLFDNSLLLRQLNNENFFQQYKLLKIHTACCTKNCQANYQGIKKSTKSLIYCILNNYITQAKLRGKEDYEQLHLAYINFLSVSCKKPLLAYVELKKYEILSHQQSYYFLSIKSQINHNLENYIRKQQVSQQLLLSQNKSLEIQQMNAALKNEQVYLPSIIQLLDLKMTFWESQIKGFNTIYDQEELAVQIAKGVQQLHLELNQTLSINLNEIEHLTTNSNVLELKLASVFFSAIMNDYYSTSQCEFLISEIFNMEHTLSTETITNLTFVEDKAVMIMISMVKNRGQIVNRDRRNLAQYFGYEDTEFQQITNISQLMPNYMQGVHDQLLTDYLQRAKSFLFNQYTLVFSADKLGFLVAQQLKIDNNFMIREDYILMGVLSKIKQSSEFILFNEDGRITACSQGFFTQFVLDVDSLEQAHKLITSGYIFMFFPNLVRLMDGYKKQFNGDDIEQWILEEQTMMFSRRNLRELVQQYLMFTAQSKFKSIRGDNISNQYSLHASSGPRSESKTQTNNYDLGGSYSQIGTEILQVKTVKKLTDSILLFDKEYQQMINQYIQSIEDKSSVRYAVKYQLKYKSIGGIKNKEKGGNDNRGIHQLSRQFFILELTDIRRKDIIEQTIQSSYTKSTMGQNQMSLQNNQNATLVSITGFSQIETPYQEMIPNRRNLDSGIKELLLRLGSRKDHHYEPEIHLMGLDSGRDSMSYGPLSQRAHFINPSMNKYVDEEMPKIDQDFNELQLQLNSASGIVGQVGYDNQEEIEQDDSNRQLKPDKSSTMRNKDESGKVLKLLRTNKMRGNHKEEEDIDALKSKTSGASKSSGVSAFSVIRKFQTATHLIQSLRSVAYINFGVFMIIISLIIIHISIISQGHSETITTIEDINGPLYFNRNYLEILSFSWSLVFNSLGIVPSSKYLIQQTTTDLRDNTVYEDLASSYDTFLSVEQRGLLSSQTFIFVDGVQVKTQYTYFMNLVTDVLVDVLEILVGDEDEVRERLNQDYMASLLTQRANIHNVYTMASELIESLKQIFLNQSDTRVVEMQTEVIVEIICVSALVILQLYFWRNIESYCQQLMLLMGRLQETDATEQIARTAFIKETLLQQSGKYSWKKQNYYHLCYSPINSLGIQQFNAQSRFLRDFTNKHIKQHQTLEQQSSIDQSGQKRKLNVVLNSRIYKSQISLVGNIIMIGIWVLIISLYFVGGFILYKTQVDELIPTQTLVTNYITFTTQLDTLITCALIIKTQPIFYDALVEDKIYDRNTLNSYHESSELFGLMKEVIDTYSDDLTSIYEDIIQSQKISDVDKEQLFSLYEKNFCLEIKDQFPMCSYQELGHDAFAKQYGDPDLTLDDNVGFVSQGIIGVISRLDTLFNQMYDYELDTMSYQPNLTLAIDQINTLQFRNAIIWHFVDTNDGTNQFLAIIQASLLSILDQNLDNINSYFIVTGTLLVLIYGLLFTVWIYRTNQRLIRVRLSLINLPIDVLTEQHTLSLLKRLN